MGALLTATLTGAGKIYGKHFWPEGGAGWVKTLGKYGNEITKHFYKLSANTIIDF